jgi:hypothetical protein
MKRTQARIREKGRTLLVLDPWPDIDTVLDLAELWRRSNRKRSSIRSRTAAQLATLSIWQDATKSQKRRRS